MTTAPDPRALDAFLNPQELNRALALAMGWTKFGAGDWPKKACLHGNLTWYADHWHDERGQQRDLAFATSLDALRDGPERVLRAAGWCIRVTESTGSVEAEWYSLRGNMEGATADTEVEARAHAALAALQSEQSK